MFQKKSLEISVDNGSIAVTIKLPRERVEALKDTNQQPGNYPFAQAEFEQFLKHICFLLSEYFGDTLNHPMLADHIIAQLDQDLTKSLSAQHQTTDQLEQLTMIDPDKH